MYSIRSSFYLNSTRLYAVRYNILLKSIIIIRKIYSDGCGGEKILASPTRLSAGWYWSSIHYRMSKSFETIETSKTIHVQQRKTLDKEPNILKN